MRKGIMVNIDDTHFIASRFRKNIKVDRDEIVRFAAQYEGTQVTDLVFSLAGRIAGYPSKVITSWIDKYLQKEENGYAVDYSDTYTKVAYDIYVNQGLDPFAIWLNECRRMGIRGWISLRMNDCHDHDKPASVLHPDFFHEHPEYRRVTHRPVDGYFDRCFDYAEPAVRERELKLIEELLERYDMDGVELDWQREAFCLRPGAEYEGIEILNDFTREVSKRVKAAAEKRGHAILLSARVPADPKDALEMGFDATTWAREGLVQVLTPTPRWATCDSDIPVPMWKRLLHGTDTILAPGIEILMWPGENEMRFASRDQVMALAEQHFALGADKNYLFNYFDDPKPEDTYWTGGAAHPDMGVKKEHQAVLLNSIGDPDMTKDAPRSHVVTFCDMRPAWRVGGRDLPFACKKTHQYRQIRVCTGRIDENAKVTVRLGVAEGKAEDIVMYANRKQTSLIGQVELKPAFFDHAAYEFSVINDGKLPVYVLLEIATQGEPVTIDYVEIRVE
ncbi:MAG: hypothetical protein E7335_03320 [Clostridiales bacterium]|nr:hypothetical protein [Clostridiales bacterium]